MKTDTIIADLLNYGQRKLLNLCDTQKMMHAFLPLHKEQLKCPNLVLNLGRLRTSV